METSTNSVSCRGKAFPYECMDSWQRFNKTSLPDRNFYSGLTMEDVDAGYTHAERVWKNFKIKSLGKYHDLYV